MLIVGEELKGFLVDSEDDEPTSRRISLAGSRTGLWDDEDDGLSQCPTSEVLPGVGAGALRLECGMASHAERAKPRQAVENGQGRVS